ncbi:hypothetical protein VTL71DRAFT_2933 [Oculimacula yallundae]|uniref:Heterokaryon incompatibility domain-containing protein n=1 Tax=Oculimacula yallundae TaxID=86028 RepID=A0ABR4C5S1_9HELO
MPLNSAFSKDAFRPVDSWLKTCLVSGYGWDGVRSGKFPTRVIDVGPLDGSQNPILTIPSMWSDSAAGASNVDIRYIALSYYCWGSAAGVPFLTTTSSNIEERKCGIPMSNLPKTFQDAVTLMRGLRVRFLWIDSLCIIQGCDDLAKADWEKESSKMSEVYGGAFLTIAVASASNVQEGILDRDQVATDEIRLDLWSETHPELEQELLTGSTEFESGTPMESIGAMRLSSKFSGRPYDCSIDQLPAIAGSGKKFSDHFSGVGGRYVTGL